MFFFFFSKPYITIVGEMIDFKQSTDKLKIQKRLASVLDEINNEHEEDISAKFMPTINNEFQGLICKGANMPEILLKIKNRMHPVKIRFGVGIGEITTEIHSEISLTAAGPGYDKARESLEYLRVKNTKNQTGLADVHVEAVGDYKERMRLINTIFSLMTTIEYTWSDRQREIICDMMEHKDKQSSVAGRLGITQSTVQKSLTAAKYYTYEDAFKTLETVFTEIGEQQV